MNEEPTVNIYQEIQDAIQRLSSADKNSLSIERDAFVNMKRLKLAYLLKSEFVNHYVSIQRVLNTNDARHIVHHSLDASYPLCECGKILKWCVRTYLTFCSPQCAARSPISIEKNKRTCLERYGEDSPAKVKEFKDKAKATTFEKYGVEFASQSPSFIERRNITNTQRYGTSCTLQNTEVQRKTNETMIARYGVSHPSHSDDLREKAMETCKTRYGTEYALQAPEVRDKIKTTVQCRYGVTHVMQVESVKNKAIETMIERYGVANPSQSPEFRQKIETTNLEKYEVPNVFMSEHVRERHQHTMMERYGVMNPKQIHMTTEALDFLSNDEYFTEQVSTKTMAALSKEFSISCYPIYTKMKTLGLQPFRAAVSEFELEVSRFVSDNYGGEIIHNSRDIIPPKELDIYVPELNFAIECNGSYWHSELNGKDRGYHNDKTNKCLSSGITLFHLWEHDWTHRGDIIRSMLLSRLKRSHRIYARKCMVSRITAKQADEFFEENHLQGTCTSTVRYGLFYQDELVAAITFGKPRYNKAYEWELLRLAAKKNTTVVGGAGKLFKEFMYYYSPNSVISYSNRMSGSGNVYKQLGFMHTGTSAPGYYYTNDYNEYHHRSKFQKHKLAGLGLEVDDKLTEWQIMQNNGYDRYHDSGNDVFVWNSDTA